MARNTLQSHTFRARADSLLEQIALFASGNNVEVLSGKAFIKELCREYHWGENEPYDAFYIEINNALARKDEKQLLTPRHKKIIELLRHPVVLDLPSSEDLRRRSRIVDFSQGRENTISKGRAFLDFDILNRNTEAVKVARQIAKNLRGLQGDSIDPQFAVTSVDIYNDRIHKNSDWLLRMHILQYQVNSGLYKKYIPEIADTDFDKPLSLTQAYDAFTTALESSWGSIQFRNVLYKLETDHRRIINTRHLAHVVSLTPDQLKKALFASPSDLWKLTDNGWEAETELAAIAKFFGEEPQKLLPQPETKVRSQLAADEVTQVESALDRKARIRFGKKAEELIRSAMNNMGVEQDRTDVRTALEEAIRSDDIGAFRNNLPNLAHLRLMWAADPNTIDMRPGQTVDAFLARWGIGKTNLTDGLFSRDAGGAFAWTVILQARQGLPIMSYGDFVSHFAGSSLGKHKPEGAFHMIREALNIAEEGITQGLKIAEAKKTFTDRAREGARILEAIIKKGGIKPDELFGPSRRSHKSAHIRAYFNAALS